MALWGVWDGSRLGRCGGVARGLGVRTIPTLRFRESHGACSEGAWESHEE